MNPGTFKRTRLLCLPRVLALVATLACCRLPAASNLILDGGFEGIPGVTNNSYLVFTGNLGDGWTVTRGEIVIERGTLNGVPHSGNQFAYLDGDFALNTLSQTIPTTPGQQYTVSFWVADTYPNLLQVAFGGQTLFSGTAPAAGSFPASQWVNEVFTVTATGTSAALEFSGQWTSGSGTVLDDVSIVAVPEPAAATIVVTAASCCLFFQRGRGSVPQRTTLRRHMT